MLATMELLLTIICISALIGFVIGVASGYMLATLGTTNQETGVFSDKMDRAVETEEFSRTVEFFPFGKVIVIEPFKLSSCDR